ncbi:MAG: potassium/proton antiporter [Chloroflexi bacterium]|nr:MAG: potassium/proton antiporter [Chloroflexota bacterium]
MSVFTYLLLGAAILLLLGVISSKASGRLGVPALLLFLVIGMLAGSEGIGGIEFSDVHLAQNLGVIALIFILFSGGFDTEWARVRPVLPHGLVLATVGVLLTALLVGVFAILVLGFSWRAGLLLGAIVSSTDAAAVFAILRSRGVGLRGSLQPLIELESGSNDPMAIFLTTAMIGLLLDPAASVWGLVPMFLMQMVVGGAAGYVLGKGMVFIINRLNLAYDGLYPVLTIALVLLVYSVTDLLGGNGFLAVYLAGLVVGNTYVIHRRSLMRFHDGLAWLMQIVMFVTLGLLVFPSRLLPIIGIGLVISAFLILIARPVSVFLCLVPFRLSWRKIAMVGWVGLRGAVPIILATFPLMAGVPQAETIFNLVFFIVLTSVLIQGSTIPPVARWLHVSAPMRLRPRSPLEFESTSGVRGELVELELPEHSTAVGRRLVDLRLPGGALLVLIGRGESFIVPSGSTTLEAGDVLHLLADHEALTQVKERLR